MSPSGIQVNKPVLVIVLLIIGVIVVYRYPQVFHFLQTRNMETESKKGDSDVEIKTIPYKIGDNTVNIFSQKIPAKGASKGDILFLHGQKFSSQTWVDLKTMSLVAGLGYTAAAIDLPGTPISKSDKAEIQDKNKFLEEMISVLSLKAPVIVSPSLSGMFSLPYLFKDPENVLKRASGFVPVAPVKTDAYTPEQYKQLKIPAAIVYGEKDTVLKTQSVENLKNLPLGKLHEIKDAGHAAYMNKPEEFHEILTAFLKSVFS